MKSLISSLGFLQSLLKKQAEAHCLVFQICTNPNSPSMKRFGLNLPLLFKNFFYPFPVPNRLILLEQACT